MDVISELILIISLTNSTSLDIDIIEGNSTNKGTPLMVKGRF
jgi:hypothetical protein